MLVEVLSQQHHGQVRSTVFGAVLLSAVSQHTSQVRAFSLVKKHSTRTQELNKECSLGGSSQEQNFKVL